MIYITGDCHGDYSRFTTKNFPEGKEMTKDDYVIVCGDFGYWNDSKEMNYWLDWLNGKPFTVLWVDGNHENFDMIKGLKVEEWHGGRVNKIRDNIIHLMRGEIYEIEGKKFFTFGGARSHDIQGGVLELDDPYIAEKKRMLNRLFVPYRINHLSWWEEEMPSKEEMTYGLKKLEEVVNEVDFIISHCCCTNTQALISGGLYERDELTDYFDEVKRRVRFDKWYFGHYHFDRVVSECEVAVYKNIFRIV